LPGIRELTGRNLTPGEIIPAVKREFASQTGWMLKAGDWTDAERQRIGELIQIKYSQRSWNEKR